MKTQTADCKACRGNLGPMNAKGFCSIHCQEGYHETKPQHTPRADQRFWSKVNQSGTCWLWTAYVGPNGYPRYYWNGMAEHAHRMAYRLTFGVIPKDKVVDHICRNPRCVRPNHLRLLTRGENVLAGVGASALNKAKQHCPKGHRYNGVKKSGDRFCRTCRNETEKVSWERRKQTVNERRRCRYALAKAEGR